MAAGQGMGPAGQPIASKVGDAQIKMVGQTADDDYGSNPDEKGMVDMNSRDLTIR